MQVKRLIELLSELDPEVHVFIGDDSADTEVDYVKSNRYRVLLTGDTSLYNVGFDDGYDEDAYGDGRIEGWSESYGKGYDDGQDDGYTDGWKAGVEHGGTADYKAAYADGYDVGVNEAAAGAFRRGYDRGFKDYPDHPYDATPEG